jgi:uncharacterized protein YbaP (TraB family)
MTRSKQERRGWFVAVCCFLTLIATTSSIAAQSIPTEKHCVWRVTNVPVPFYLVGSIHNLRGDDYPLAPAYRKALKDSERLVFEFNPRERNLLSQKFREVGKYPKGQDIRGRIHSETLALLIQGLRRTDLRIDDIKQYKPWAIALRLLSMRQYRASGGARSVDNYFSYHGQRLGKEVGGLETVEEHVAFWENMLEMDGERLLATTLSSGSRVNELFDETRVAWKRGNIAALSATNARLRDKNSRIAQRLYDRRHAKWLPRIEDEMKTGRPTAIIAGAGHFSGPNSVVDLLEKRGYKIKQL